VHSCRFLSSWTILPKCISDIVKNAIYKFVTQLYLIELTIYLFALAHRQSCSFGFPCKSDLTFVIISEKMKAIAHVVLLLFHFPVELKNKTG
jgi:hypothetical protein